MRKEHVKSTNNVISARIFSSLHDDNCYVDEHFHNEIELLRVDSGNIKCTVNSKEYNLEEGDIIFFNSSVPHSTYVNSGCHTSFIQFKHPSYENEFFHLCPHFTKSSGTPTYVFQKNDSKTSLINIHLSSIIEENLHTGKEHIYKILSHTYMLIALLYQYKILIDPQNFLDIKAITKITPVLEIISERYTENLSLDYLSSILHLNKNYFCRLFKKATGTTTVEYINYIRCYHAQKLLLKDINISEISYSVGFSSLSYFNRTFKKFYFCSPSAYKNIAKRKEGLV